MIDDTVPINLRVTNQGVLSNDPWKGKLTSGNYTRHYNRLVLMCTTTISK
jgi:hypothetical protein